MRPVAVVPFLIFSLAGCEKVPSFNQRYEDTASNIQNQASTLDQEIENSPDAAEREQ